MELPSFIYIFRFSQQFTGRDVEVYRFPLPPFRKGINIINQSRDPDELLAIIKEMAQSEKSGQAADQPARSNIDRLTEGLDEESMRELRKYITFLHARKTLDDGRDENSAGLDG